MTDRFFQPGDRVRLVAMPDDPSPIPAGTTGTVTGTTDVSFGGPYCLQVQVDWDNGRRLRAVCPPDILAKELP